MNPVFIKGHILRDFPEVLKSLPLIERGIVRSGIQPAGIFRSQIPPVHGAKNPSCVVILSLFGRSDSIGIAPAGFALFDAYSAVVCLQKYRREE